MTPSGPRTSTTGGEASSAGVAMNASVRSSAGSGETITFSARTGSAYGIRRSDARPPTSRSTHPCTSCAGASTLSVTVTARRSPGSSRSTGGLTTTGAPARTRTSAASSETFSSVSVRVRRTCSSVPARPKDSAVVSATTAASAAAGMSSRPAPLSSGGPARCALAPASAERTAAADQSGCSWRSSAAAPATCGAAMLVPLKRATPGA